MPDDKKLKAFLSSITRKLGGNASGLLKAFTSRLYEDGHLEDLQQFDAGALAEFAKESLEFFKAHRPGRAGVAVSNPAIRIAPARTASR